MATAIDAPVTARHSTAPPLDMLLFTVAACRVECAQFLGIYAVSLLEMVRMVMHVTMTVDVDDGRWIRRLDQALVGGSAVASTCAALHCVRSGMLGMRPRGSCLVTRGRR